MAHALRSGVVTLRKNELALWVCRFQRLQRSTMEEMVGCVNAQSECTRECKEMATWRCCLSSSSCILLHYSLGNVCLGCSLFGLILAHMFFYCLLLC
jgi:hypothetical protein